MVGKIRRNTSCAIRSSSDLHSEAPSQSREMLGGDQVSVSVSLLEEEDLLGGEQVDRAVQPVVLPSSMLVMTKKITSQA